MTNTFEQMDGRVGQWMMQLAGKSFDSIEYCDTETHMLRHPGKIL